MVTACNATHDVVCACEEGFFRSEETGQCVLCDLCPAGWGASTACGSSTNTVCRKCLNGTYSDVLNATASCRRCTVCGEGQRMLQTCTATQDTICLRKYMDIPPTYRYDIDGKEYQGLDRFYPGHGGEDDDGDNQPPAHHDDDDDGGIDVIPLYCAALGAVVVGLLAYVALVHYRRMRDKRMAREPHEDVEYSKASCADSGIYVESDHHHHHHHHQKKSVHAVPMTSNMRLRDVPQAKKKELEKTYLAGCRGDSDWKSLARELGYNSGKISSFESRGSRDPGAPFRHVIHDWSRLEGATIGAFLKALRNTGRHDVVKFLQAECNEHLQPLNSCLPQQVV
ncbi:tumor necrosis factor receptor superfamily member 16-like [Pomacea canaliculata]|uniref:tumor necrosis factor receptor superfamily member 16-like n=1 Tax=Pomacea canaliculata TaxID=400727 RepID=UPI000D736DD8|nr:tumor necrosis factor receptor superfamily member 16-like [Pomacea canaliculata]